MDRLLWVCLGGGLGSGARYLVELGMVRLFAKEFPLGTLTANLLGSFLLALLLSYFLQHTDFHQGLKLLMTTGFMGGFTTYSTYNYQTLRYLQRGELGQAALYAGLTFFGCMALGYLGAQLTKG